VTVDHTLPDRIQALHDSSALNALAILAERHQLQLDVQSSRVIERRIAEALSQPNAREHRDVNSDHPAPGALARLVLVHFAGRDVATAREVEHALSVRSDDRRVEPVTLGLLGAVVLYVFSSEISLEKKPHVGWSFRFHHTPLKESTTGKLLGELFKLWRSG
jgi:hypothetical protein